MGTRTIIKQYKINTPTASGGNIIQDIQDLGGLVKKIGISVPQYLFMYNVTPPDPEDPEDIPSNICCLINGQQFQLGRTFIYETDQGSDESMNPNITSLSFPNLQTPSTEQRKFPGTFPVRQILVDVVYQQSTS